MSAPPARFLMIDTNAVMMLSPDHTHEEIGAALVIVSWMARGQRNPADDIKRIVAGIRKRRWTVIGPSVLAAVDKLVKSSEPRARFGRPSVSQATRARIFARDGMVCRYCDTAEGPFHIDHIEPLARGGSNRDENLGVACAPCNFSKAASLVSEWNW